jgi:hypothetical protein
MPISPCHLLMQDQYRCATGQTCAIVNDQGATSCVDVGPAQAAQDCNAEHCMENLVCLGDLGKRKCFQLCHVGGSDCTNGLMCMGGVLFSSDQSVGVCQ